jgi:hypothetical protein
MSDQFFHPARFPASSEVSVAETYSPTVGMNNVTHANDKILINFSADTSAASLQFYSIEPATPLRITLKRGEIMLLDTEAQADPTKGNRISVAIADGKSGEPIRLTIKTSDGKELIAAETRIK